MTKEPYRSARRVFWIVDNRSDHRGKASIKRLQKRWRNLILVHLAVYASWLNQVEIYHAIIQRKVHGPQRLRRHRRGRPNPQPVRAPLQRDRQAVRLDLHARELLDRLEGETADQRPAAIAA